MSSIMAGTGSLPSTIFAAVKDSHDDVSTAAKEIPSTSTSSRSSLDVDVGDLEAGMRADEVPLPELSLRRSLGKEPSDVESIGGSPSSISKGSNLHPTPSNVDDSERSQVAEGNLGPRYSPASVLPTTMSTRFKINSLRRHFPQLPARFKPGPTFVKEFGCYWSMTTEGMADASTGALIPYMQPYFHITYTIVALLFVSQCIGFASSSLLVNYLTDRFGLGKVITFGALVQGLAYVFMAPPISFPITAVAYVFAGFGMALQNAMTNAYIAGLPNSSHKLGLLHGGYGFGALISPLVGTAFISAGIRFSFFYFLLIGVSALNVVVLLAVFRLKPIEEEPLSAPSSPVERRQSHSVQDRSTEGEEIEMNRRRQPQHNEEEGSTPSLPAREDTALVPERSTASLREILSSKIVWISCTFLVAYVGSEVTMGGWIITFILTVRHGDTSSGYIATGFWLGLTLGRLFSPRLNLFVGEKRIIFFYLIAAFFFQLIIWFVPSLVGNGIASGFIGLVLGPFYPLVISHVTKLLPRSMHTGAVGFAASFGQLGAAIFPFMTGALAQTVGVKVLPAVMIGLFVLMSILWAFMPDVKRREE